MSHQHVWIESPTQTVFCHSYWLCAEYHCQAFLVRDRPQKGPEKGTTPLRRAEERDDTDHVYEEMLRERAEQIRQEESS